MNMIEFDKLMIDIEKLYYQFEHLHERHEDSRELRTFFARLKREVKKVNEDLKNEDKKS